MKHIYTLHSDAENATPPIEQFGDYVSASNRMMEIIEEFRRVWEPGHTVDWETIGTAPASFDHPYRLFERVVIEMIDASGHTRETVTLRLYEFDMQPYEEQTEQQPVLSDALPTGPGYYWYGHKS